MSDVPRAPARPRNLSVSVCSWPHGSRSSWRSSERRDQPGPGLDSRLRADAPAGHRRGDVADRTALDRPLGLLARPGRRPRLPRRHVGRPRRDRRRAALPRDHELEHGRRRVVGALRGLGGRPGRLGRHRPRRARRAPGSSTAPARASTRSWTWSLPASCSRRRSGAGATTSTRSSSGSRATCPGPSRSRCRTGLRDTPTSRRSTRPSSTSRSGACSAWACSSSSTGGSA